MGGATSRPLVMTDSLLRLFADAAGLSLLACLSVSLWTLRVTVAAAGRKLTAAAVAGVESLLFVLAFGTVLSSLQDPVRIAAYAIGVAGGTLLGMVVDERLSTGRSLVRLVVDGSGVDETTRLRDHGWPATRTEADGVNGPVAIIAVAVDERVLGRLSRDLDQLAPNAFRTVERLRDVRPTVLPASMHQPHGHHPRAAVR
jgi:uncharacterized protein YebE (UPF0316 family)